MKKDIPFLPVKGIQVVVARKLNEINQYDWQVFLINQNTVSIHTVFVTSHGYGKTEDELQKTSTLRHFFTNIEPGEHQLVETMMPDLFHLNNEFWVSYFIENQIFDKYKFFIALFDIVLYIGTYQNIPPKRLFHS